MDEAREGAGLSGASVPGGHRRGTFEPEFAGLEGQCFIQAKLQARTIGTSPRPLILGSRSAGSVTFRPVNSAADGLLQFG